MAVGAPFGLVLVAVIVGVAIDLSEDASPRAGVVPSAPTALVDRPPEAEAPDAAARPRLAGSVTDYCSRFPTLACPTYAEAWEGLRRGQHTWCVVGDRAGACDRVETGTCGARRYVRLAVDPICGGVTSYFDAEGTMVGVVDVAPSHEVRADGKGYADPIRASAWGHVPECDHVATESTCAARSSP